MVAVICGYVAAAGETPDEQRVHDMLASMIAPGLSADVVVETVGRAALGRAWLGSASAPGLVGPTLQVTSRGRVIVGDVWLHDRPDDAVGTDEERLSALLAGGSPAETLSRLRGEFAFATWDAETEELLLGRDHFGVRPLFHATGADGLAFASMERALTAGGFVTGAYDEVALLQSLHRRFVASGAFLAGVAAVPPGTTLRSGPDAEPRPYWRLADLDRVDRSLGFEAAAASIRQGLELAVARRTPRGAAVAAHLSGGLDSSSISALAARRLADGARLHTYAFVEDDEVHADVGAPLVDERPWVAAVAAAEGNIDVHWVSQASLATEPRFEPDRPLEVGDSNPEQATARSAAAVGADVVLSGWGGDECVTFNGRGVLAGLALRGRWFTVVGTARAFARRYGTSVARQLWAHVGTWLLPKPLLRAIGRAPTGPPAARFLRPGQWTDAASTLDLGSNGRENRLELLSSPHIQHRLENWAYVGNRHGVRYSFPMLDVDLVERALRAAPEHTVHGGQRRALFRQATMDILPDDVRLRRPKFRPYPGNDLRLSGEKEDIEAWFGRLAAVPSVQQVLDVDAITREVAAIPSRAEAAAEARRATELAIQPDPLSTVANVIVGAAFVAHAKGGT